jgi:predicted DNA-binding transcriptional regulator YafY/DNA-directed RNA polymerase subunit RPC12/RpoP
MGNLTRPHLGTLPMAEQADVIRLPVGSMRLPGRSAHFMEIVRFAAANYLCVEMDYTNQKGERHPRFVEPYSLRRTKDDNILLMAVDANTKEDKSYRIDQIHGAKMTNRSFTPRYQIELTPTSVPQAPALDRKTQTKSTHWGTKPVYIYRCLVCNKKFEHSSRSSKLRAHKNQSGLNCSGKSGQYETTTYK